MPGHAPYLMPNGQSLTRYLTFEEERKPKKGSRNKKGGNPRGKDLVWNQLLIASARLKGVEGMDPAAIAELQSVQRVGHRRRRRWFNDRLLRDMAGPMTAKEMEAHFNPPPWGEQQKPSSLSVLLSESDVWDIFRNIDMDKEARLIKRWEAHNAEALQSRHKQKATPLEYAHEALEKWAQVDRGSRSVLKQCNPHTVLEMEMQILDEEEKGFPEPLNIPCKNSFASRMWRGLAQFHGLHFSEKVLESDDSCYSKLLIADDNVSYGNDDESNEGIAAGDITASLEAESDLLEITCTDVLLAIQEHSSIGLNARLLAGFVVTQIHGLDSAPHSNST